MNTVWYKTVDEQFRIIIHTRPIIYDRLHVKSYKCWGPIQTKQQCGFKLMLEDCWKFVLNVTACCQLHCYLEGIHSYNLISSINCEQFLYLISKIINRIIAQIIVALKMWANNLTLEKFAVLHKSKLWCTYIELQLNLHI